MPSTFRVGFAGCIGFVGFVGFVDSIGCIGFAVHFAAFMFDYTPSSFYQKHRHIVYIGACSPCDDQAVRLFQRMISVIVP